MLTHLQRGPLVKKYLNLCPKKTLEFEYFICISNFSALEKVCFCNPFINIV